MFKKGFATRTQWTMGDNASTTWGTTATNIGTHTNPSQVVAAGDRKGGPFQMTGLRVTNKGAQVGDASAYNF